MAQLVTSFWNARVAALFAEARLADAFKEGPLTCGEASDAVAVLVGKRPHEPFLCRLLFAASHLRLLSYDGDSDRYTLTSLGALLEDSDVSLRAFALMMHHSALNAWSALPQSLFTGKSGFEQHYGTSVWRYLESHPDEGREFDKVCALLLLYFVSCFLLSSCIVGHDRTH